MRAYWILPNRDQSDDILASDGETIVPLRQVLDPMLRPEGFSHGVPTEILEKCSSRSFVEVLFAQRFLGYDGNKQLFCVSTPAGLDSSGRVVHLGLVFILEPGERPGFELSCSSLSAEDKGYANALIRRMTSAGRGDIWARSVRDLLDLPPDTGPATNVALGRSVVDFYSHYVLGSRGLTKKPPSRLRSRMIAFIPFIILAVVGAWFSAHATKCHPPPGHTERVSRRAVGTGVVTWRFN